jgi:hypothetical protein
MKKLEKSIMFFLLFGTIIITASCNNEAFRDLDYYWENAKVIKLDNNATGITVPVKDNPENPEYKGQKMLYLYESDSKYQALLQEILPESRDKIDDEQKN